jgi:hypothetical protein
VALVMLLFSGFVFPVRESVLLDLSWKISSLSPAQAKLAERALELLALPEDGVSRLLLDIGLPRFFCGKDFLSLVCVCPRGSVSLIMVERISMGIINFGMKPVLSLFVGCGSGLSGETLSENGHIWIGLDISQAMLGNGLCGQKNTPCI